MNINIFVIFEGSVSGLTVNSNWSVADLYDKCVEGHNINVRWVEISCDDVPLTEMDTKIESSNLYEGCEIKLYRNEKSKILEKVFEYRGETFDVKNRYDKKELEKMYVKMLLRCKDDDTDDNYNMLSLLLDTKMVDINCLTQEEWIL